MLPTILIVAASLSAPVPKIEHQVLAVHLDTNTIRVGDPLPVKVVFRPDQDYVTVWEMEPNYGTLFFEVCDPDGTAFVNFSPTLTGPGERPERTRPPHKYVRGDVAASASLLYSKANERGSGSSAIFAEEGVYKVRAVIPHQNGKIVSKPVEVKVRNRPGEFAGKYISDHVHEFAKVSLLQTKGDAAERLGEWITQNSDSPMVDLVTQYRREAELDALLLKGTDEQIKAKVDELTKLADAGGSIRKDTVRLSTAGVLVGQKKALHLVPTILEPVDPNLFTVANYLRQAKESGAKK